MTMHIGHAALRVTDLERSIAHAMTTLGLRLSGRTPSEAFLTSNARRHELQLIAGERAGLDHIGLEVETEDELSAVRDRLVVAGVTLLSEQPQEPGLQAAMRFAGPAGITFELYTGMERAPLTLDNLLRPLAKKLGHLTLFSEDKAELEHFLLDTLGFRVSDRWDDAVTWMRCDPDHHGLAVGHRDSGTWLHHYAFELAGWSTIGAYADHIARDGQQFLWGPGRHGPGLNIFTYLPDPEGAIVEVYTDLLRIDNDSAYQAVDWSQEPRGMNLWGPLMPEDWNALGVPVLGP